MDDPPSPSRNAGGFLLAVAIMAGAIVGIALHQPSAGLVAGIGVGALLAIAVWVIDRRRS